MKGSRFLKRIAFYLTRRYTKIQLAAIAVLILFCFLISESNIFTRISYDAQIMTLKKEIKHYRVQTEQDKERLKQLNSNKEDIEKFARENFLMKNADEDIFIIE